MHVKMEVDDRTSIQMRGSKYEGPRRIGQTAGARGGRCKYRSVQDRAQRAAQRVSSFAGGEVDLTTGAKVKAQPEK